MHLTYKDITIRNATAADAPQLETWWNDGAVMAHAGFPYGLGTTARKIAEDIASDSDETRRRLLLLWKEIPIGEMCYENLGNGCADIGIKICEKLYQEKGIGRVALSILIADLFCHGFNRIVLSTNPKNTRAQHVYEKLGFQKTRVNIDSWQNQLGQWESSIDYQLTADTFIDFAV